VGFTPKKQKKASNLVKFVPKVNPKVKKVNKKVLIKCIIKRKH